MHTSHLCGSSYNNQNLRYVLAMYFYGLGVEISHDQTRFAEKRKNSVMSELAPVVFAMNHLSVDLFCPWIPNKSQDEYNASEYMALK